MGMIDVCLLNQGWHVGGTFPNASIQYSLPVTLLPEWKKIT